MHSQLADVDKGMVVRCWRVHAAKLHQGGLHEVDGRQSLHCSQLAVTHKSQVEPLQEEQGGRHDQDGNSTPHDKWLP